MRLFTCLPALPIFILLDNVGSIFLQKLLVTGAFGVKAET